MKIRFGLNLDGQRGYHADNQLGEVVVGPNGLLGILEPQLGLIADAVPQSQRVVQYLDCLKSCDTPARFYHKSLAADELGTASTLLQWRDQWYLHGWDGCFSTSVTDKLKDLAEVENVAKTKVFPSEGQRLTAIHSAMNNRKPAISKIILDSPLSVFPKRWQNVLQSLPTEVVPLTFSTEDDKHFLARLQQQLVQANAGQKFNKAERLPYESDGSFVVLRAETAITASAWLADQMKQGVDDGLLVAGDSASLLDDVLAAMGNARNGLSETSAYRPSLQLLPMVLALLWKPIDFSVMIAFLSHPVSPVWRYASRKIAGKFAEKPGIGGEAWQKVLDDINAHYGKDASTVQNQINTWIDHPRFELDQGAPIDAVIERTGLLQSFFSDRISTPDEANRSVWMAGYSQVKAFRESLIALQKSGNNHITPTQLNKLLVQATARGSANPKLFAEVGSLAVVDNPSAIIEQFDRVFWFQPVMPLMPESYSWSKAEISQLEDHGVKLPLVKDRLAVLSEDWLRPILSANKRLVIVLPPKEKEVHPVWQMIEALVNNIDEHPIEQILCGEKVFTEPVVVQHKPLPIQRRWWQLSEGFPLPEREKESFSSLELLLFNPYHWLLKYPAGLKASKILSVSDDSLLYGKLLHGIVERYFLLTDALTMAESNVSEWFDTQFPRVIESEGAVLNMHGRRADLESFRYKAKRALSNLLTHIKGKGIKDVKAEKALLGSYLDIEIQGYADLVLTNTAAQKAIVDMKWGGRERFSEKLQKNTHLQLGLYAELLRQESQAWPEVAYFILSEAKLLATNDYYFPAASVVNKKVAESNAELWERFKASYQWRRSQLNKGEIEVVMAGIDPTVNSVSPIDGLASEVLNSDYNEYRSLAGWRLA